MTDALHRRGAEKKGKSNCIAKEKEKGRQGKLVYTDDRN